MKLSELAQAAHLQFSGTDTDITNMSCRSDAIKQGGLFFAVKGTRVNGADFIDKAVQNKAAAVVAEQAVFADVPVIVTPNIRRVMAQMADKLYPSDTLKKVAVTGTNGKTSTVYYVAGIMNALGCRAASMGTIGVNSPVLKKSASMTTPDTCIIHQNLHELATVGVKAVAMEASSHGLDQDRLAAVSFEAVGFTNITQDHLDYHKTMRAYFEAKKKLLDRARAGAAAVLNADIPEYEELAAAAHSRGLRVISYGQNGEQLKILSQKATAAGGHVELFAFGKTYEMDLAIVGDFQVMNILCAIGLCVGLGADSEDIMAVVPTLTAPAGRLERVALLPNGASVYVDYAHTPDALERVLKAMRAHTQNRLVCVFGCGGNRDTGKRPLMGAIAAQYADQVYVTDDNPRFEKPADIRAQIMTACPTAVEIGDRQAAVWTAVQNLQAGDVLVLAGKGHEAGQTINGVSYAFDDKIEAQLAAMSLTKHPLWRAEELKACLSVAVPTALAAFGISIDTRTLQLGDLFVALKGDNSDGHTYVKKAVQAGAAACLVDHAVEEVPLTKQIIVPDVMQAFNRMALFARNRSMATFIAVTGSSGKTTTKEMLKMALSGQGATYATAGNYNNHIGVPLTLTRMGTDVQYAVIETGMNHEGELAALSALVQPHITVVTMIGAAHLAHFKNEHAIALAKAEIFTHQDADGTAVLNTDGAFYSVLREKAYEAGIRRIASFGHEKEADFALISAQAVGEKTKITADWHRTVLKYEIGFLGEHFAINSLAVLAAVDAAGASVEQAMQALSGASAVAGRGLAETVLLPNGRKIVLIDDAYNANPSSMLASIRTLGLRPETVKIAVLGDMLELGETEVDLHVAQKEVLMAAGVHKVYATGRLSKYLYEALPVEMQGGWYETPAALAEALPDVLENGAAVLVKASNGSGLKQIVVKLKGHL
ncbi:MAG: UDP-N-acetylmuramoyl-L-alanyl-D-glutamate--2,6-diaminopimelate ligase [Alphaproteobacteria bacterium]